MQDAPVQESAQPRLYLVVPPDANGTDNATLEALLAAGDIACVLLLTNGLPDEALAARIERLRPQAQERGVAFLIEDRFALAAETACDGAHLNEPERYRAARARLGGEAIVGVGCGASRHAAMVAGEHGADYVGFGAHAPPAPAADPDLLAWWQELMTVPCVGFGAASPEECADMVRAGADFVAPGPWIWTDPRGPEAAVRACQAALSAR